MTLASAHVRSTVLRRTAGVTVVLGLLAGSVIFYADASTAPATTVAAAPATVPPPEAASPEPTSARPSSPAPSTPVASSPAPSTPVPSSPASSPPVPRGLPRGPGTTEPGVLLVATPASDGSFDVSEMVRFAAPTSTLSLRPPVITDAGRDFADARPWASDVQVSAGEDVPTVADGRVAVPVTVTFDNPTDRVELRYRLRGVTVRSLPSRAGRALAVLGPVTAGLSADAPVAVRVNGDAVRNLQCPTLPLPAQPCAKGAPPRLQIAHALPWRRALVIVQLDLPQPS